MPTLLLRGIRHRFQRLSPCHGQVAHVLRTLLPVAGKVLLLPAAPRLACVKPAASVHPEPGSNSSLYISYISQLDPDLHLLSCLPLGKQAKETDALVYFVLGTCFLYTLQLPLEVFFSVFSMNSIFSNGLQRYGHFLNLQIFSGIFIKKFLILHSQCHKTNGTTT